MSKMSELSLLLDELTACGNELVTAAKTLSGCGKKLTAAADALRKLCSSDTEKPPDNEKAGETLPTKAYSFEEVRKAFAAKSHEGFTKQVKALITKYGADRLSAVKEEDYPSILAELEVIE